MDLKYDIYNISNVAGSGEERKYVRLKQQKAMTASELEATIQNRCSLTKGDVAAVLTELRDIAVQEFAMGRRFYIPEIGYFSLSIGLEMPEDNPDKKITGKEVRLRGINFRPEASFLQEVGRNMRHIVRSEYTSQSRKYDEEKLWAKLQEYFKTERYITLKLMCNQFGLSRYTAQKWLDLFISEGRIIKDGTPHSPIYFPA